MKDGETIFRTHACMERFLLDTFEWMLGKTYLRKFLMHVLVRWLRNELFFKNTF